MITLLASIAGFMGSIVPEILKFFKDLNDKKHQLAIIDKKIERTKISNHSQETFDAKLDSIEQIALYSTYSSGNNLIDGLNGSVRPVLAYCFFIIYASVKFVQYRAITSSHSAPLVEYIDVIWNVDDQAIFAGIISFYFGQRTFSKAWNRSYK